MSSYKQPSYKKLLMGGAVMAAMAILPGVAHAAALYPYAYASNVITGLQFSQNGQGLGGLAVTGGENISDAAQYQSNPPPAANQAVGTINQGITIAQAYAGPGPTPPAVYTAVGAGNFTGARSDAAIGANTGTGSSVSNVAEASGNSLGNSNGTNAASLNFTFIGNGAGLTLSLTDAINLNATTSGPSSGMIGATASASVQDIATVIEKQTINGPIIASASFNLFPGSGVNAVTSVNGVGTAPYSSDISYSFTTPFALTNGYIYSVTLTSLANESITPGTPVSVPEPGSLILLGTGLLGLGLVLKRKNTKKV